MKTYRIESLDLFMREMPPARMQFTLGKKTPGQAPKARRPQGIVMVRLRLRGPDGRETFGCSGDWPSYGWLDKRPGRSDETKLTELTALIQHAREIYLQEPEFETPFAKWHQCHERIMAAGRAAQQEALTSSFASALMERSVLDAVSRFEAQPVFTMVKQNRLGFQPERVHPELEGFPYAEFLPAMPRTRFYIRHTVGTSDPITAADHPENARVNDGEPETLEEYIRRDGVHYFKVKISGDADADLDRLAKIWDVLPKSPETAVTLDGNEAYEDLERFARFVERLEDSQEGLFQHILFIEQPLTRTLTHDPGAKAAVEKIRQKKDLVIDEADGSLNSFKEAFALGYAGTSHKNCKGFFKSLLNHALVAHYLESGKSAFMSAEDLSLMPIVPLQQDFAALGILGLPHCERNGHHYTYGLTYLTPREKEGLARHHSDLYVQRDGEWFLNIRNGMVDCASLQCPGFGVCEEPDWGAMIPLDAWLKKTSPS